MNADAEKTVHYINTGLLLVAPVDLDLLVRALAKDHLPDAALSCLHVGQGEGVGYQAHFEAFGPEGTFDTPEESIKALLDAVERLAQSLQPLWQACTRKTLDIGYESGVTPRCVTHPISIDTLARLQLLGIDLCISVYSAQD